MQSTFKLTLHNTIAIKRNWFSLICYKLKIENFDLKSVPNIIFEIS